MVTVNSIPTKCLIDSGSTGSVISLSLFRKLKAKGLETKAVPSSGMQVYSANGRVKCHGRVELNVCFKNHEIRGNFWIMDMFPKMIIGLDLMTKHHIVIDAAAGVIHFGAFVIKKSEKEVEKTTEKIQPNERIEQAQSVEPCTVEESKVKIETEEKSRERSQDVTENAIINIKRENAAGRRARRRKNERKAAEKALKEGTSGITTDEPPTEKSLKPPTRKEGQRVSKIRPTASKLPTWWRAITNLAIVIIMAKAAEGEWQKESYSPNILITDSWKDTISGEWIHSGIMVACISILLCASWWGWSGDCFTNTENPPMKNTEQEAERHNQVKDI